MTHSFTAAETFTIIHARKLSSKVAADMHLCAQYYGEPSEARIREFAEELAQYLNAGYVKEYEFGYEKERKRIVTWRYKVDDTGQITTDDRPGKVVPYVDVSGANFFNFLTRNSQFFQLSANQREAFEAGLPFRRVIAEAPSDGKGGWIADKNYFSGGFGLNRQTFRPSL